MKKKESKSRKINKILEMIISQRYIEDIIITITHFIMTTVKAAVLYTSIEILKNSIKGQDLKLILLASIITLAYGSFATIEQKSVEKRLSK